MKPFLKLNNLNSNKLISLSPDVDTAYLRVRHNLHPLAMYLHERKDFKNAEEATDPSMKYISSQEPVLFTDSLLKTLQQHDLKTYAKLINSGKGKAFHIFLAPPNFMGVFAGITECMFDFGDSTQILTTALKQAISNPWVDKKHSVLRALSIRHPEGDEGVKRSLKLLANQSQDIYNYFR